MPHRHCFALDLADDPRAVEAYEAWHAPGKTPAEIIAFFRGHGVEDLQIHRAGNRMFMVLDLSDAVSAEAFFQASDNPAMTEWSALMLPYQQSIAFGAVAPPSPSQSWVAMSEVFDLKKHS